MSRKVYVEFTRPKGKVFPAVSLAIRAFERTPYSHVRLRWNNSVGKNLVYEASGSSVRLIGSKAQKENQVEVVESIEFELTQEQYRKLIELFDFAGVQYGFLQIIGIAVARILGLKKNPLDAGRSSQVCSELIGIFITTVLNHPMGSQELDLIGPAGINKILKELKQKGL